ncbi:hypothetical protein VitviT2T_018406 [Vitis vinifera]|uniref:peroxidase n=1 Tax=Vitis vinifera TaxID=29760 RepID=A0ABY9CXC5_VITVI|nr:hypothetical protein VitviT2T_018406 [Vitis vinifera]
MGKTGFAYLFSMWSGCNASILITGSSTERIVRPNSLLRGYEVVDDAKTRLEAACPGVVSCADILALVTHQISKLEGAHKAERWSCFISSETANLPVFRDSIELQKQKFIDKGLDDQDLVALVEVTSQKLEEWVWNTRVGSEVVGRCLHQELRAVVHRHQRLAGVELQRGVWEVHGAAE